MYDKTITSQKGATEFFGENAQLLADNTTIGGVTLHNDGTATNADGNQIDLSYGIVAGGNTIVSPNDKSGSFMGFNFGGALGGGLSFEVGFVEDPSGNRGLYFSFQGNSGLGSTTGGTTGINTPTGDNTFSIFDFAGNGNSYSGGLETPIGGYSYEKGGSQGNKGFTSFGENYKKTKYSEGQQRGYIYNAVGKDYSLSPKLKLSLGVITASKTWVFPF